MNLHDKPIIPCFLCGDLVRVKLTKKDKPYFICEPCGVQVFIRYKPGIKLFRKLLTALNKDGEKFLGLNKSSFETISLVSQLNRLKGELKRVDENKLLFDYFVPDTECELAEKALERELKAVRKALRGVQRS